MADGNKFILICDESGAVGFTDKPLNADFPIGIVAGVLFSEDDFIAVKDELPAIANKYEDIDGKLHITELTPENQEALRKDIFDLIEVSDGLIVYEAVAHQAIQARCAEEQKIWDEFKKAKEKEGYSYNIPRVTERMLSALFQCCFIRTLHSDLLKNTDPSSCEIAIYTDPLDKPILDEIAAKIAGYLNIPNVIKTEGPFTRFNKSDQKVESLEGTAVSKINLQEGKEIKDLSTVKFSLSVDDTMGLLADVVSNSLLYTLKESYEKDSSIQLFSPDSVASHALAGRIPELNEPKDFDLLQNMNFVPIENGKFVFPEGMTIESYFLEASPK